MSKAQLGVLHSQPDLECLVDAFFDNEHGLMNEPRRQDRDLGTIPAVMLWPEMEVVAAMKCNADEE